MRRFVLAIYAATALSHALFALAAATVAGLAGASPYLGGALALLLGLGIRGRVARVAGGDRPIPTLRLVLFEEPYFAHWFATVLAVPAFALAIVPALAAGGSAGQAALGAYACSLVVSVYGVFVRRRWVRVRHLDVRVPGLPQAFDGYRLAQLSDLHIGGFWPKRRAEAWIRRVRALEVDLVVLTGDYVTLGTAFHEDIAAVLGELRGREGALAVLGNHDYFDAPDLVRRLEERGVRVLRNEVTKVARGDASLTFAGIDDTFTRHADVDRTMDAVPDGAPSIVLAHDPRLFPELASRGASLVLSGHTHWGQVAVPFFAERWNPSRASYRHHAGLYRLGDATLYVCPGLGTTGPPLRLGAPPEITVITLRA